MVSLGVTILFVIGCNDLYSSWRGQPTIVVLNIVSIASEVTIEIQLTFARVCDDWPLRYGLVQLRVGILLIKLRRYSLSERRLRNGHGF